MKAATGGRYLGINDGRGSSMRSKLEGGRENNSS
jgi:hypothetical protein